MDDEAIWKTYKPQLHPWFSTEISYEGWGIATFEKPIGTVEGKTRIDVGETGELKIVMEYERLNTDVAIPGKGDFRIAKFLNGNIGEANMLYMGTRSGNVCSKLTIHTDAGVFESDGSIYYSEGFGLDNTLRMWFSRGTFTAKTDQMPKYWVVPLINFISSFHQHTHPLLTQHPLRLFSTSVVPETLDEKQRQTAFWSANRRNLLIAFEFGDKFGYIEPMPNYAEIEQILKSQSEKQCVSALMVGEIIEEMDKVWFPHDYINLLSLASGAEVGASWLEFRDESGKLVSRKHFSAPKSHYEKGYAAIDEGIHGGLGHLMSVASKSQELKKTYLGVLISQLTQVSSNTRHIENRMTILSRAIEGLCKEFNLAVQELMTYLPETYQQDVESILSDARKDIQKLSRRAKKEGLLGARDALQRIESKISNANNKDGDFGLKVISLLDRYKMPDAIIMNQYYSARHGYENKSWAQLLSQLRNTPIHHGYFEIQNGLFRSDEIMKTQDHLHDILVRIAFKILGYTREYQPAVIDYLVDGKTADWVTESTSAKELGYPD